MSTSTKRNGLQRQTILQVVAPAEFGGLEQVVRLLATGLAARGHAVTVATLHDSANRSRPFDLALRTAGVAVEPVFTPPRRYDSEVRAIQAICKVVRPHIVHTHGTRPDVIAGRAARTLGLPRVTTVHGFVGGGWKNRLYERLQVRAIRRFDRIIAVSRPLHTLLMQRGVNRDRLALIQNAWTAQAPPVSRTEARRELGLPSEVPVVGWVGRLSNEKGPDVFIRALAHLADPRVRASVVGDGADMEEVRELAARLGVVGQIHFHGTVHDVDRLYKAFDCFVLSSRTEGTPIVLFEAMAAEVPIVATRVGGVSDVLSESECRLVEPEDPAQLASAVREMLAQPELAAARAQDARESFEKNFATDSWIQSYEMAYDEAARRHAQLVG